MRILVDALESPQRRVTPEIVSSSYGGGQGIKWMYQKRLDDLLRLGLIKVEDDAFALTDVGTRHARLLIALRRLFSISPAREKG